MTDDIEAAVHKHTHSLPVLRDLRCVHAWESGGGDEWFLAPRKHN